MRRRIPLGWACVAVLAGALRLLAAGPLPEAWRHWRYFRAISLPPASTLRLVSVALPPEIFAHAQPDLADIRVIDDLGTGVPYARITRRGSAESVSVETTLLENSFAPGRYTQIILSAGKQPPFHNAVRIRSDETEFIEWVRVEASDNAREWRIVQPRAPIFQFEKEGHEGTQTFPYSENNARYLRIRILDGDRKFPISGATILRQTSQLAELVPWDISLMPEAHPPAGRTVWTVDAGAGNVPLAEVRFAVTAPPEFIRSVELSSSTDKQGWLSWARGEIYRYHPEGAASRLLEHLALPVPQPGPQGRYWRLEILNRNDAPLDGVTPRLYVTPPHVVFEQQPARSYRLLYDQPRIGVAHYDLEHRIDAAEEGTAVAGQAGPEEENSDYSDPRPWSERHKVVLWILLGLAVALLAYSAIRSLRRSAESSEV